MPRNVWSERNDLHREVCDELLKRSHFLRSVAHRTDQGFRIHAGGEHESVGYVCAKGCDSARVQRIRRITKRNDHARVKDD